MNQIHRTAARIARRTRSAMSGRVVRAATVAGVAALAIGTAGSAYATTHHQARPFGFAPTEECLNWSGSIQYFPGLTTTSHSVTAVIRGTLSNCNFQGTPQTFSGSVFGVLTGSGVKSNVSLSGNVAITWPADANLNPSVSPITISNTGTQAYQLFGTISGGAGTGEQLEGSYDVVSMQKVLGGNQQNILGTAPFGIFINEG